MTLTISSKGWVVIPAELRKKYGLKPGSKMHVVDYGGVLTLIPALDSPVEKVAGMLRSDRSLTRALLAERQEERARER